MKKIGLLIVLFQCSLSAVAQNQLKIYIPLITNKTDKMYTLQIGNNQFPIPARKDRKFMRFPINIEKISGISHQIPIKIYNQGKKHMIDIDFGIQKGKQYVAATMLQNNKVITTTKKHSQLFHGKIDLYITLDGNNLEKSSLNLKKRVW